MALQSGIPVSFDAALRANGALDKLMGLEK